VSSKTVTGLTEDQALLALTQMLDPNPMFPFLVRSAGLA